MKSERRPESKTSPSATGLEGVQYYWSAYGSQVLLVILVALIVFLLVRYWNQKKAREAEELVQSMQQVHQELSQLDQLPFAYMNLPGTRVAEERQRIAQDADQAIANVLSTAKDPKILARAWLARGELDWKLANLPDPPGADTQPTLRVGNKDTLLADSRSAFEQVLQPQFAGDALDLFAARLGLAAIAENQGHWDEAHSQYQQIVDATTLPDSLKDYARTRLQDIPRYDHPVMLAPPPPPSPAPPMPTATTAPSAPASTTAPAVLGPALPPGTRPARQMSILPTTQPGSSTRP